MCIFARQIWLTFIIEILFFLSPPFFLPFSSLWLWLRCLYRWGRHLPGFLKSRRDRRKEKDNKKVSKKKRDSDASSVKSEGEPSSGGTGGSGGGGGIGSLGGSGDSSVGRDKERFDEGLYSSGGDAGASATAATVSSTSSDAVRVDEEGYTIRPKDEAWSTAEKTSGFYSSSDADSGI